jgi:outer membrane protein TolC
MKKFFISIIILSIHLSGFAQKNHILDQYLFTAAQNNPGLKAAFNNYMAALEQIPQVSTLPDPQIAFDYFIMPIQTKTGPQISKISMSQMFPWFGTLKARQAAASFMAKAKYEIFLQKKSILFFEVKTCFYELYLLKKSIIISKKNLQLLSMLRQLALVQFQNAKTSSVDVIRIDLEKNDLKNSLAKLNDIYNTKKIEFNTLLNNNIQKNIIVPDTLIIKNLEFSYSQIIDSLKQNHSIQNLSLIEQSLNYKEKIVKKQGMPKITIGATYTFIGNNQNTSRFDNNAFMFKIGISLPIYRKKYDAMIQKIRFSENAVNYQKNDKKNSLIAIQQKAYADYLDAGRRISLYDKQKQLALKAIKILENEYKKEGKNFEEIIRLWQRYLRYSLQLERARSDKLSAKAFIMMLLGK